jgi:archaellum component FlaC
MKEIIERLERKVDEGFTQVDKRLDMVDARLDMVDARLDKVDGRLDKVDGRLDGIDAQLQKQGVLLEAVHGDVKMALEGIVGNRQVMDRGFADVMKKLDERVQPVELATRHFARQLAKAGKGTRGRRKTGG